MIIDGELELSTAQANITTASTYVSENIIDLGNARDIGVGEELTVNFNVDTTFASGTSIRPEIVTSDSDDLSSAVVHAAGPVIVTADLVAGFSFNLSLPQRIKGSVAPKRYLGVRYVSLGTFDAGAISARIVKNADAWRAYPQATNVTL